MDETTLAAAKAGVETAFRALLDPLTIFVLPALFETWGYA